MFQPLQAGLRACAAASWACAAAEAGRLRRPARAQRSDREMQQLQHRLQQTEQSQQQVLHVLTQAMRDPSFLQQLVAGRPTQFLTDGTEAGPDGTGALLAPSARACGVPPAHSRA